MKEALKLEQQNNSHLRSSLEQLKTEVESKMKYVTVQTPCGLQGCNN